MSPVLFILLAVAFFKATLIAMIQIYREPSQSLPTAADNFNTQKVKDLSLKIRNKDRNGYDYLWVKVRVIIISYYLASDIDWWSFWQVAHNLNSARSHLDILEGQTTFFYCSLLCVFICEEIAVIEP